MNSRYTWSIHSNFSHLRREQLFKLVLPLTGHRTQHISTVLLTDSFSSLVLVYPSLEDSDGDEPPPSSRSGKKKRVADDGGSWLPGSNSGRHSVPREKRPTRENAIRPSVKAELDMAKKYLDNKPQPVSQSYNVSMQYKKYAGDNLASHSNKGKIRKLICHLTQK